jgi:hypothetical protein
MPISASNTGAVTPLYRSVSDSMVRRTSAFVCERPEREPYVLPDGVQQRPASLIAALLLRSVDAAERAPGRRSRGVEWEAGTEVIVREQREVGLDLLTEIALVPAQAERTAQP